MLIKDLASSCYSIHNNNTDEKDLRSHTMWQAASKGFYDIYLIKHVKCTLNTGFL